LCLQFLRHGRSFPLAVAGRVKLGYLKAALQIIDATLLKQALG
jgi:hypothetical protein